MLVATSLTLSYSVAMYVKGELTVEVGKDVGLIIPPHLYVWLRLVLSTNPLWDIKCVPNPPISYM